MVTSRSGSARDRWARGGRVGLGGGGPWSLRCAGPGGFVGGGAGADAAEVFRRVECPAAVRGRVLPRRDLADWGGPGGPAGADAPGTGLVRVSDHRVGWEDPDA